MEMITDDAVVKPVKTKKSPKPGPLAVMVSPKIDLIGLCRRFNRKTDDFFRLYFSRLYPPQDKKFEPALAGPMVGAPYAVMILESLITWGARKFIFFGWCGAVSDEVKIGDIILPTASFIDEGTSRHYLANEKRVVEPSALIVEKIKDSLSGSGATIHEGFVWSTDGVYRETRTKIKAFQRERVLGVDMELSALFSASRYRGVDVGGILVVSDELSTLKWQLGFKTQRFKKGREMAAEGIVKLCQRF